MADPTQYSFELREATIALIKEADIHEGVWMIGFEFSLGVGVFGAMQTDVPQGALSVEARPGALMQISKLQLARLPPEAPKPPFAVDAAVVNPAPNRLTPAPT